MSGATTPISEIYGVVIQGEGPVAGQATIFVRTGGCDYRCGQNQGTKEWDMPWVCDSLFAVLPQFKKDWTKMTADEILLAVNKIAPAPMMVTLSGGNPAMHASLHQAVVGLRDAGYRVWIETQGTFLPAWAYALDGIVISPKPPSSGMVTNYGKLDAWLTAPMLMHKTFLKIAARIGDLPYVGEIRDRYKAPVWVQPVNEHVGGSVTPDDIATAYRDLCEAVLARGWYDVFVIPQLHALAYSNERQR